MLLVSSPQYIALHTLHIAFMLCTLHMTLSEYVVYLCSMFLNSRLVYGSVSSNISSLLREFQVKKSQSAINHQFNIFQTIFAT